jgi:hypothetical protein
METDGPYFDTSLIGPDGKMTRLHKGGKDKANALQAEANALAMRNIRIEKRQNKVENRIAVRTAQADRKSAAASARTLASAQAEATKALQESQAGNAPTQYIEDEEAIARAKMARGMGGGAFGVSSSRAMSQFGLGGAPSYLG